MEVIGKKPPISQTETTVEHIAILRLTYGDVVAAHFSDRDHR